MVLRIVILALVTLTLPLYSYAESDYWHNLRKKMERITPKKERVITTAVGGVRGAKNSAEENLYWMGEEQPVEVSEEEYLAFTQAVETAESGDRLVAVEKIEAFLVDYPDSQLKPDALNMIVQLQESSDAEATDPEVPIVEEVSELVPPEMDEDVNGTEGVAEPLDTTSE